MLRGRQVQAAQCQVRTLILARRMNSRRIDLSFTFCIRCPIASPQWILVALCYSRFKVLGLYCSLADRIVACAVCSMASHKQDSFAMLLVSMVAHLAPACVAVAFTDQAGAERKVISRHS